MYIFNACLTCWILLWVLYQRLAGYCPTARSHTLIHHHLVAVSEKEYVYPYVLGCLPSEICLSFSLSLSLRARLSSLVTSVQFEISVQTAGFLFANFCRVFKLINSI